MGADVGSEGLTPTAVRSGRETGAGLSEGAARVGLGFDRLLCSPMHAHRCACTPAPASLGTLRPVPADAHRAKWPFPVCNFRPVSFFPVGETVTMPGSPTTTQLFPSPSHTLVFLILNSLKLHLCGPNNFFAKAGVSHTGREPLQGPRCEEKPSVPSETCLERKAEEVSVELGHRRAQQGTGRVHSAQVALPT